VSGAAKAVAYARISVICRVLANDALDFYLSQMPVGKAVAGLSASARLGLAEGTVVAAHFSLGAIAPSDFVCVRRRSKMERRPLAVGDRIELHSEGWTALVGTVAAVSEASGTMKGRMIVVELQPEPRSVAPRPQQPQRQTALA
jgi:hypothetical protein